MDRRSAWVLGIIFGGLFLCLFGFLLLLFMMVRSDGRTTLVSGDRVGVVEVTGPITDSKKVLKELEVDGKPRLRVMNKVDLLPPRQRESLRDDAGTVHVSAVIPNFRITEYFVNFEGICRDIATASLSVNEGWIDLPTAPGLGIDIDVDRLRAHPHQEVTKHGFRQYWEEYPRKGYVPKL